MAQWVTLGRVRGAYGVRGWIKVESHTDPPANILNYSQWTLRLSNGDQRYEVLEGRPQGDAWVVALAGVVDRDAAAALAGCDIVVARSALPALPEGEYYWADLTGLAVRLEDGRLLGSVSHVFATGANDVLVVRGERERLIPFIRGEYIKSVDLDAGVVVVEWDPDF